MPFLVPKIVYPASGGPTTTLDFAYPPVEKSMTDDLAVMRNDSFSLSRLRQSMWIATDRYIHLAFKNVPVADLPAIAAFVDYALQGGTFLFFEDATATAYVECEMATAGGSPPSSAGNSSSATDGWSPTYAFRGFDEFEWWLRKVPGGLTAP